MIYHIGTGILAFLVMILAGGLAAAQTTEPVPATQSIEQLKLEQQQTHQNQWRDYPRAGEKSPGDVVSFKRNHGLLVTESKLPPTRRNSLVSVSGLGGLAMYRFTPVGGAGAALFFLERYDFSDVTDIDTHEMFMDTPSALQVVQFIEWPDRMLAMTLMQGPAADGRMEVTLRVQLSGDDDSVRFDIKRSAATFDELRWQYPADVDQYLRPIFRRWGQERAVFSVDEALAWQVVSDTWQTPPEIAANVMHLLKAMNVDDYPQREAAQEKLSRLGEPAALYLMSIDRSGLSGEQKSRVEAFLRPFRPATAEQVPGLRSDASILLDCLYSTDEKLDAAVMEHLKKATAGAITIDLKLTGQRRAAAISAAHRRLSPPATEPTAASSRP